MNLYEVTLHDTESIYLLAPTKYRAMRIPLQRPSLHRWLTALRWSTLSRKVLLEQLPRPSQPLRSPAWGVESVLSAALRYHSSPDSSSDLPPRQRLTALAQA